MGYGNLYRVHRRAGFAYGLGLAGFDGYPGSGLDFSARQGLPGVVVVVLGWLCRLACCFGALSSAALFDNFIGRKRNVDGGVLAAGF